MKIYNQQPIETLRSEIRLAIRLADFLFKCFGMELEVTWTTGGNHKEGSLHPKRRAFDCLKLGEKQESLVVGLRSILGPDYDVLVEADHLHIEWDPK